MWIQEGVPLLEREEKLLKASPKLEDLLEKFTGSLTNLLPTTEWKKNIWDVKTACTASTRVSMSDIQTTAYG